MKVSELIKQLEDFKNKNGDVPVLLKEEGFDGYGVSTLSHVSEDEIYPEYIDFEGYNIENPSDFNFTGDSDDPVKCLILTAGQLLYST